VPYQPSRQRSAWAGAVLPDQLRHPFGDPLGGRDGARARSARHLQDVGRHGGDLGLGEAVEPGKHHDGQLDRVLGDEVGLAVARERVDQLVGGALAGAGELDAVGGLKGVADGAGTALVVDVIGIDEGRVRHHHRHERPVGGNLVPQVPQLANPAENVRVAGHMVHLAICEDEPGRDVADQQDGRHPAVLAPDAGVDLGRVECELEGVKPGGVLVGRRNAHGRVPRAVGWFSVPCRCLR
jgi:hypothetical protein